MPYYTEIFLKNFESKTSIVLNEGGARSSKSHSMCQLFIYKMLNEKNKSFLITRKTLPALRITAYKMFFDILMKMNLYDVKHHNKTQRTYTYKSNYFLFTSLDHPVKIQSTEFNYIWMEEAEEFTFDDFVVLKTRLSSPSEDGKRNQMFLTYNPKNESSYINKRVRFFEDVTLIKSTYKSNPFISEDYIKIIESLKDQDNTLYQIYALGEYACIEGQIFTHIRSANHYPSAFDEVFYGLDFGYNNPSCLVKIGVKDEVFYLTELFYLQKLTTLDIINLLAKHKIEHYEEIYADPSSPEKINEIQSQGFNIISADNNVLDGINFLKSQIIYTRKSNTNINNEINEYVWRKDKNGNYIDIPVKYNDHAMDAIRYAIYSHCKNRNPVNIRIIRHHF